MLHGTGERPTDTPCRPSINGPHKALITDHLGSLVLEAAGPLMFHESSNPAGPVLWLNHDIVAKRLNKLHG